MTFEPARLTKYPLFRRFWETSDPHDGLAHRGLDEVTPKGVRNLVAFAKDHELDGRKSSPDARTIDQGERALIKNVLQDPHYGAFFELDATPPLERAFGIEGSRTTTRRVERPSGGRIPKIEAVPSKYDALNAAPIGSLPGLFERELHERRGELRSASKPAYERSVMLAGLFKTYASALWSCGETPDTEAVGRALLDTLIKEPHASPIALTRVDGLGMSWAQTLALGLSTDLSRGFQGSYPDAYPAAPHTYLSMNPVVVDVMTEAMKHVDAYREAMGLKTGAAEHEQKPVLAHLLGEVSGHLKPGNLSEAQPFSSSGLNYGKLLFPGDNEIAKLPPRRGFEFHIDCIDAFGSAISASPKAGDHIRVVDADGHPVQATKVVENGCWSATFKNVDGEALEPSQVKGLICDAQGQVKGDGKTQGALNMYWWGFCDRNTAQRLYKSKFKIPQFDVDVVRVPAGDRVIELPAAAAQKIFDAEVSDLVTNQKFAGFRFNDEPSIVELTSGEKLRGKTVGVELTPGPGSKRLGGDAILIAALPTHPIGAYAIELADGTKREIAAGETKYIVAETQKDFRPSQYLAWLEQHGGLFASDASTGPVVSNGVRWINDIEITKNQRPDWAGNEDLIGLDGPLARHRGDEVLWVRGLYSASPGDETKSAAFSGWVQLDKRGSVINEGFITGQPDFVWGAEGPLDWSADSSYNPFVDPMFRLKLFVNGIKDETRLEAMAEKLNLPENWRELRCRD